MPFYIKKLINASLSIYSDVSVSHHPYVMPTTSHTEEEKKQTQILYSAITPRYTDNSYNTTLQQ